MENILIDKIIIYQFGKVGSCSLYKTFIQYGINTIHTHVYDEKIFNEGNNLIINITRNLFDRNISSFFQNYYSKPNKNFLFYYDTENKYSDNIFYYNPIINDLINNYDDIVDDFDFKKIFLFFKNQNIKMINLKYKDWYNDFNKNLNINIFNNKFNISEKYNYYHSNNNHIIILRYEDINNWENIFNIFLKKFIFKKKCINITSDKIYIDYLINNKIQFDKYVNFKNKSLILLSDNLTSNKSIYQLYNIFKKKYKYSNDEIEIIKNINYMIYFYSEYEINEFIFKYSQ